MCQRDLTSVRFSLASSERFTTIYRSSREFRGSKSKNKKTIFGLFIFYGGGGEICTPVWKSWGGKILKHIFIFFFFFLGGGGGCFPPPGEKLIKKLPPGLLFWFFLEGKRTNRLKFFQPHF